MKKITIGIEGMMCGMCEVHVNDAFRQNLPGLKKVTSDRRKKRTVILAETDPGEAAVRQIIDQTGYSFLSYTCEEYRKGLFG